MAAAGIITATTPRPAAKVARRRRAIMISGAVAALILCAAIRSAVATRFDGLSLDEPFHITAGVSYVRTGDYRLNPEHPPLTKLWVGVWQSSAFELPPFRPLIDKPDERDFTQEVVFLKNDPDLARSRARAAMLTLNALLLLAFALAAWRVFGGVVAAAALAFLVIDPTVAAHMPVVMTDLPVALLSSAAVLLAVAAFRSWRVIDLTLAGLALGLALGAKHSALITAIAVTVIGGVMIIKDRASLTPARFIGRAGKVAAVGLLALAVLWSLYGLRYGESAEGSDLFNRPLAAKIDDVASPALRRSLHLAAAAHLLPRAYIWGLADTVRAGVEGRAFPVYFFGASYIKKTPFYFFPALLLFKLPIGLTVLALAGAALILARKVSGGWKAPLLGAAALASLFLFFLAFSGAGYAGVRHALPVVPVLALFGGVAAATAIEMRSRALRTLVVAGFAAAALSAVPIIRPWEYYNEMLGGPANGSRHFSDEGTDLGHRTLDLARYYNEHLRESGETPFIVYDMCDQESEKRAIPRRDWGAEVEAGETANVVTGTFFISSQYLAPSPWYDLAAFRTAEPAARFGNLFIFRGTFELPWLRAEKLYERAMDLLYSGEKDAAKAERLLDEAVALYPNAYTAALELGNLRAGRGAREEAIRAYEIAISNAPPGDEIIEQLRHQIERVSSEPPESVAPLRNPWLE